MIIPSKTFCSYLSIQDSSVTFKCFLKWTLLMGAAILNLIIASIVTLMIWSFCSKDNQTQTNPMPPPQQAVSHLTNLPAPFLRWKTLTEITSFFNKFIQKFIIIELWFEYSYLCFLNLFQAFNPNILNKLLFCKLSRHQRRLIHKATERKEKWIKILKF